ncbi:MAG: helix-turn-helix domain-containing protein, partial [Planctomycetota bacterium]
MTNESGQLQGCDTLPPMLTPEEAARQAAQGLKKPKGKRQGRGGRFGMLNTFVDCTMATLPRTDALVWIVLFRDVHGDTAKSAQAYIADRAGVCRRTVKTAIKRLTAAGLVDVVHRGGLNRGLSIYRIR